MNQKLFWSLFWPTLLGTMVGVAGVIFKFQLNLNPPPPLSPLGEMTDVKARLGSDKQVIGFLPYWLIKDAKSPFEQFNQVIYFGVTLSDEGKIMTKINSQEVELGWYTLQRASTQALLKQLQDQGTKIILAVTAFDNQTIDKLIGQPEIQQKAIVEVAAEVKQYDFDGVNIDFEYSLDKPFMADSGTLLAQFIKELRKRLIKDNPAATVSVDIYVNGLILDKPYDLVALNQAADQIIIMAYDFHTPDSATAGPIAPIRSTDSTSKSIVDGLQAVIKKGVAMNRLVLGVPLYGYEWQTTSSDFKAQTAPGSGVLATYKRIMALLKEKGLSAAWDEVSLSPWLSYQIGGKTQQIYFDNEQSIALKLQLIDQLKMQGVAFWALGYEGNNSGIWEVVKTWQKKQS